MKNLTIFLFLGSHLIHAQVVKREYISFSPDSIHSIEITDHQNLNYNWYYGRTYQIKKNNDKFILTRTNQYNKPFSFSEPALESRKDTVNINNLSLAKELGIQSDKDSLTKLANSVIASQSSRYRDRIKLENISALTEMGEVESNKIRALFDAIIAQRESQANYILPNLGIDSSWLNDNAGRLWNLYKLKRYKASEKAEAYCIRCIKNREYAKRSAFGIQGSPSTSDYPFVEIKLITRLDTLVINTGGQEPFMLPWNMNNKYKSFNPRLSLALADILPFDEYTNKQRLRGYKEAGPFSFEGLLTKGIIQEHCVEKNKKKKLKTSD
jgi:hypothetical protein